MRNAFTVVLRAVTVAFAASSSALSEAAGPLAARSPSAGRWWPNAFAASVELPIDRVRAAAEAAGIDPSRRAEALDIAFAGLAARI